MTGRGRPDRYCWCGPVLVSVVAILTASAGLAPAQAEARCQWLGTVDMSGRDRDHLTPAVAPIGPGEGVADRLSLALRYAAAGQSFEGQNEFERALNGYLTALDVFRGDAVGLQLQPEQVEFLLAYTMIGMDVARLRLRMGQAGAPPYCYDTSHEYAQYWDAIQQALWALNTATERDTALRVAGAASPETWKIFYVRYWYQLMRGDVAAAEGELRSAYQLNPVNPDLQRTQTVQHQQAPQQRQALPQMQPSPMAQPPRPLAAASGTVPRGFDTDTAWAAAQLAAAVVEAVVPKKYGVAVSGFYLVAERMFRH
jgi:tetratricopeptide (TPR) repeat protein